jgi:spore photoproduct lyase
MTKMDLSIFTVSQQKILKDIKKDFEIWNEAKFDDLFPSQLYEKYSNKQLSKKVFQYYVDIHDTKKKTLFDYSSFDEVKYKTKKYKFEELKSPSLGLGSCPVASEGTRCCNLLTLDIVQSCGFDCSYCSIQSFYNDNKVSVDSKLKEKLDSLKLDKDKIYHIGTGQSSDSLMWGNKNGILDALFEFATNNPNVILEFKTKSDNIDYFIQNDVPKNILCTWSMNTKTIITNEEHLTASLQQRIQSAKTLADKGVLVGFHFHPMVVYKDYLKEYGEMFASIQDSFDAKNVALVSFGTLTFIKPVINQLRAREDFKSKILQADFVNANGKLSYNLEQKVEMFKFAYDSFKAWHGDVYFYLCMEDHSLWKKVFGYEYSTNNQFEDFMLRNYMDKILTIKQ